MPLALTPDDPPLTDGVITLRPFDDRDIDAVFSSCQDAAVQQFIPIPRPYRREDAEEYVRRTQRDWADDTKAAFAIVESTDHDTLLGAINVAVVGSAGNSGYWISPGARRRGVATRALRLLTEWAFGSVGLGVIILEIRPENEGSIHVARSAGYHQAGRIDVNARTGDKGGLIFSRLASDVVP